MTPRGGKLLFDEPVMIQCYASEQVIASRAEELTAFLYRMVREARQGAIALVIDRDYLEIEFALEETIKPGWPKGKKRR
jgi:hypothetical protein